MDSLLIILSALLLLTTTAYLIGQFPYPFGFFILLIALLARLAQLRSKNH